MDYNSIKKICNMECESYFDLEDLLIEYLIVHRKTNLNDLENDSKAYLLHLFINTIRANTVDYTEMFNFLPEEFQYDIPFLIKFRNYLASEIETEEDVQLKEFMLLGYAKYEPYIKFLFDWNLKIYTHKTNSDESLMHDDMAFFRALDLKMYGLWHQ